jgi:hypothetical protein
MERRQRLERTEARIAGLIQFISEGDRSSYVRSTLLDLKGGPIVLEPQPDGVYLARTRVFPLLLLIEKPNGGPWGEPGTAVSSRSSGARYAGWKQRNHWSFWQD